MALCPPGGGMRGWGCPQQLLVPSAALSRGVGVVVGGSDAKVMKSPPCNHINMTTCHQMGMG